MHQTKDCVMNDTMNWDTILCEKDEAGVLTITLNRPHVRNALNDKMIQELHDVFCLGVMDPDCRVIILRGADPFFCAGADLEWMKKSASFSLEENKEDALHLADLMELIYTCPKPTIAVVAGGAFGGGVGLVSVCDMAISHSESLYCLSEVRLGLVPAVISPYVQRAMGGRQTKRLTLTADRFSADEACKFGLLTHVVPKEKINCTCDEIVINLLKGGPSAQAAAKDLFNHTQHLPLGSELNQLTSDLIAQTRASPEGQEGIQAFLEKRTPLWGRFK